MSRRQKPHRNIGNVNHAIQLDDVFGTIPRGAIVPGLDLLVIVIIPVLNGIFNANLLSQQKNFWLWTLAAGVTVLLINSYGGYRRQCAAKPLESAGVAVLCYLGTSISMLIVALLLGHDEAARRYWSIFNLGLTPTAMVLARLLPVTKLWVASEGNPTSGTIIICYNRCPHDLKAALNEQPIHYPIFGVMFLAGQPDDESSSLWPTIPDIPSAIDIIRLRNVQDVVFISDAYLDAACSETWREFLSDLLMLPPRIWLAVDLEPRFPNVLMSRCGHYKLIQPGTENLINASNRTKRAFDLVFGSLLFAISLVFLILIGLLIAATSGFPIVYRQDRIGAHGQHFSILKFRTMTERQDAGFSQAVINDPRVTSFGRFLRRTSLDELLQLINVIKGDMSLVGPRPHAPETQVEGVNFENAVKFYRLRHRVKPGITGLAQIRGQRGETRALATLERRIASDLEYIENWSIWLDVAIIFKTIPIFFTQRNAY